MMTRHVEKKTQGFVSCLLDSCPYGNLLSFTFSFLFLRANKSNASSTVRHFPF